MTKQLVKNMRLIVFALLFKYHINNTILIENNFIIVK